MSDDAQRDLARQKRQLRTQMQARRAALPLAAMASAGESVARHFADHPILAFADSFAGYMAMRSEVDVLPIFRLMSRYRKRTALPAVTGDSLLQFRAWEEHAPLVRHARGMLEPAPDAPSFVPQIILTPLLAFDAEGCRLGYGGGYYDRTMAALRAAPAPPLFIGVAYSLQEVESLPIAQSDEPLDGVLTELGVSMFTQT